MPLCDLPLPKIPTAAPTFARMTQRPTSAPQESTLPSYRCFWPLQVQPSNSPVINCFPLRSEISYVTPGTVPDAPVDSMI